MLAIIDTPILLGLLALLVVFGLPIWWAWIVFKKAGLAGPIALLMIVPYFGLMIVFGALAFSEWPILKRDNVT